MTRSYREKYIAPEAALHQAERGANLSVSQIENWAAQLGARGASRAEKERFEAVVQRLRKLGDRTVEAARAVDISGVEVRPRPRIHDKVLRGAMALIYDQEVGAAFTAGDISAQLRTMGGEMGASGVSGMLDARQGEIEAYAREEWGEGVCFVRVPKQEGIAPDSFAIAPVVRP